MTSCVFSFWQLGFEGSFQRFQRNHISAFDFGFLKLLTFNAILLCSCSGPRWSCVSRLYNLNISRRTPLNLALHQPQGLSLLHLQRFRILRLQEEPQLHDLVFQLVLVDATAAALCEDNRRTRLLDHFASLPLCWYRRRLLLCTHTNF